MQRDAAPAATDEVRRRNTALVMRLLRDSGALSRADLARRSGLAKATIGTIVSQLQRAGAVAEGVTESSGRGRPSTPVVLDGRTMAGLGIEVNVDYMAVTALDLAGRELFFEERSLSGERPRLDEVVAVVRAGLARLAGDGIELLGTTIAVPGLIDRDRGVVVAAPHLGWSGVPLADLVRQQLNAGVRAEVSVAVDNDANCAARAERVQGVALGVDDFVYLTGTVGLGAGIFSNGEVLRGSRGLAGEVGHLRVGDDTHLCPCGRRGCWEALVGLRALEQATGVPVQAGEDPVSYAERLTHVPDAAPGLTRIGRALGRGVAQLAVTLDPRMVVLGGAFVPLGDALTREVEEALNASFTGKGCTVALSTLGLHAASVGAALDALDEVYAGRRSLPLSRLVLS
jgi:predicted NBD/HSP70 family sugar kinase